MGMVSKLPQLLSEEKVDGAFGFSFEPLGCQVRLVPSQA